MKDTNAVLDQIVNALIRGSYLFFFFERCFFLLFRFFFNKKKTTNKQTPGSINELRRIDLSGNKVMKKEATGLAKFAQSALILDTLMLARTAIATDSVTEVLKALNQNPNLKKVN